MRYDCQMRRLPNRSHASPRFGLLLLLALSPAPACGDNSADAQVQWFDPATLASNLREADRRSASRSLAPLEAHQVPLYDLDLRVAADQATFELGEEIYFTNTTGAPLESVVLRIYANAIGDSAQVRLTGSRCTGARCQVSWDGRSVFEVRPETPIAPDGRLRIHLDLEGTLTEIAAERTGMMAQAMESLARMGGGGEHGDYGLLAHGSGVASLGNFYAMVAPRADDEWVRSEGSTMGDLGADAISHFRARVRCAPGSRVAISGHITGERTTLGQGGSPGHTEVRAVASMTRNFAVVLGRTLEVATARVGDIELRSWFLEADRSAGEAALQTAVHAMRTFERRFGRYPYTDLEIVEAPLVGGAGGVEFSGLVTVATMFYQPVGLGGLGSLLGGAAGGNPMAQMQDSMLDFVVAHEVAHQWWHGIVGSDARQHPFVDESLAQFSSMLYLRERYGAERADREAQRQVASNYHMMRLQGGSDAAADQPVSAFSNEMAYAGLVYGKAPFLYPALREAVGERTFYDGLSRYVRTHRFRVASPRALFDLLADGRRGDRVRPLERRWLDEAHGDEDLGEADPAAMMGQWLGGGTELGPAMELMRGLMGSGGGLEGLLGGSSGSAGGGQTGADAPEAEALQEMIRALEQMGQ